MTNAILRGRPDARKSYVRFDEGKVASEKTRPSLYTASAQIQSEKVFGKFCTIALLTSTALLASAAVDEIGKTPAYWCTFDGQVGQHGASTLQVNSWAMQSYKEVRNGLKAGCPNGSQCFVPDWNPYLALNLGGGSFTVFLSADLSQYSGNPMISFGSGKSTAQNLTFCTRGYSTGENLVALTQWTGSGTSDVVGPVYIPGGHGSVHPYAIVYDATTQKLSLYADGALCGSGSFDGLPAKVGAWCLNGFYDGAPTGITNGNKPDFFLEDFRIYREALTAGEVMSLSQALPTTASASVIDPGTDAWPRYWYTFDGASVRRGTSSLIDFKTTGYSEVRPSRRGASLGTENASGWFEISSSFTIFLSAMAGWNNNGAPIVSFGMKNGTDNHLAFVQVDESHVALVTWSDETGKSISEYLISAKVDGCRKCVQPYAITYDSVSKKIRLYANGELAGEAEFGGLANGVTCCFGSVYGGYFPDDGVMKNFNYNTTAVMEDFRTYNRAFSAAEVAELSARFPVYAGGVTGIAPHYWYTFNGSVDGSRGTKLNAVQWLLGTKVSCRNGSLATTSLGNYPFGTDFDYNNGGAFTFTASARIDGSQMGALFALGAQTSTGNFGIAGDGAGGVRVLFWSNGGSVRVGPATGPFDCAESFHSYALACDGSHYRFYVDGKLIGGPFAVATMPNSASWQFGGVNGGNVWGLEGGARYCLEDFRFYHTALSETQISQLAAAQRPWPGASQVWTGGTTWTGGEESSWLSWSVSSWSESKGAYSAQRSAIILNPIAFGLPKDFAVGQLLIGADAVVPNDFGGFVCNSLQVLPSAKLSVDGAAGKMRPGVRIAKVTGGKEGVSGVDFDSVDEWKNGFYFDADRKNLWFGQPEKGFALIVR